MSAAETMLDREGDVTANAVGSPSATSRTAPSPARDASAIAIPPAATWSLRAVLLAGLTLYCFTGYAVVRPLFGTFGFDALTTFQSVFAVIVLAGFVVWLAPVTDLPALWFRHRRATRRLARGECPNCAYRREVAVDETATTEPDGDDALRPPCPECGVVPAEPTPWKFGLGTIRRFTLLLAIALALGSIGGELWLLRDEALFVEEARALRIGVGPGAQGEEYARGRAFPADFTTLRYTAEQGGHAIPLFDSPRIEDWRPRR